MKFSFFKSVPIPSYALRQEEEGEGDHVPGLGTRAGSTLLFSTTARFCVIKQDEAAHFLTSSSIAITSLRSAYF